MSTLRNVLGIILTLSAITQATAASLTTTPVAVTASAIALDPVSVTTAGAEMILSFTPETFTDPAQSFEYMWQESVDGIEWFDWIGGLYVGAIHTDREGNPILEMASLATPRFIGVIYVRLTGTLAGVDILLSTTITY